MKEPAKTQFSKGATAPFRSQSAHFGAKSPSIPPIFAIPRRRLNSYEFFNFVPTFKIFMANHKPVIKGTGYGIWRHIKLIPFTTRIPEEK